MDTITIKIERFVYNVIYSLLWIIETILFLRFVFKFLEANPYNSLVNALYVASSALMGSFEGIFKTSYVGNVVLEPSVLVAMAFYALVAYILVSFVEILHRNNQKLLPFWESFEIKLGANGQELGVYHPNGTFYRFHHGEQFTQIQIPELGGERVAVIIEKDGKKRLFEDWVSERKR